MPAAMLGGGYHLVTVYRLDDAGALVGDLAAAPYEVPPDAFAEARARIRKSRNRVVALARTNAAIDLAAAVRDALAACAAGLDGADAIGSPRNFSLDGLAALARRIGGTGKDSWAVTVPAGRRLWSVLTMLADFVEARAPGLCRPLFAEFLEGIEDVVPGAASLGGAYRALGLRWTALAHAALPEGVPAFGRARRLSRDLRAQKAIAGSAAAARVADIEAELAAIGAEMADCFPLDDAQTRALRETLQENVVALHEEETRLRQAIGQLARAGT